MVDVDVRPITERILTTINPTPLILPRILIHTVTSLRIDIRPRTLLDRRTIQITLQFQRIPDEILLTSTSLRIDIPRTMFIAITRNLTEEVLRVPLEEVLAFADLEVDLGFGAVFVGGAVDGAEGEFGVEGETGGAGAGGGGGSAGAVGVFGTVDAVLVEDVVGAACYWED